MEAYKSMHKKKIIYCSKVILVNILSFKPICDGYFDVNILAKDNSVPSELDIVWLNRTPFSIRESICGVFEDFPPPKHLLAVNESRLKKKIFGFILNFGSKYYYIILEE